MRFYAVLLISSLLATVLAAPHAQLNHDSDTATSLGRRGSTFSKSSPTQAAAQSPAQPSAESETFPQIELDEKAIGKDVLDNHDYQFFDYTLAQYNGEKDLIFRDFGNLRDIDSFKTQIEKSKKEGLYIASGVFYDPRKSRLPTSMAKLAPMKSMKSEKHSSFVIILRKNRLIQPGSDDGQPSRPGPEGQPRPDSGLYFPGLSGAKSWYNP